MTFRLGLTGSIGMGKSTTCRMFAEEGCAVWDADAAVHRLYAPGGAAVAPIAEIFPEAVRNGAVCRGALKSIIQKDPEALARIEAIVHPLVAAERSAFLEAQTNPITVLDIPLLFETGAERCLDATVVVTTTQEDQLDRVMARNTMTRAEFDTILKKQIPDRQKREMADYIIFTDSFPHARAQVRAIIEDIEGSLKHA